MRQQCPCLIVGSMCSWKRRNSVVEMTHSVSASHLGSEFDDFLFAPIGEDRNGMLLSVLSALARLDLDPWQEAAKLAGLPGETAIQRLASLIAGLPDGPSMHQDPGDDCCSPDRALAAPGQFQYPVAQGVARCRCGGSSPCHHLHVCDLDGLRAGRPMDRSKPSTARTGRQQSYTGLQHRLPTVAPAERWPVTINWAEVTGRNYDRRQNAAEFE